MAATSSFFSSNSPLNIGLTTNENNTNGMSNYKVVDPSNGSITSLFGNTKFTPYPNGVNNKGYVTGRTTNIHSDGNYDISATALIDYTKQYASMNLTAAHFAYLKDIGVYPNNRLMVARRFGSAVGNDLTSVTSSPLATLISWVPNDNDFMDISFGEKWEPAAGSFEDVLNGIGKDVTLSQDNAAGMASLGTKFYEAGGMLPLPGLMEGLQRSVMKKMGIVDDADPSVLPQGNPNLIKEAMKRRVVLKGQAGSGLSCKFSVKMKVEYEQKYINGIDNTLSYFDLIANVLSFSTSDSEFMYNSVYAKGSSGVLAQLVSGDITAVIASITKFVTEFTTAVLAQAKEIANQIKDAVSNSSNKTTTTTKSSSTTTNAGLQALTKETIGAVVGKYKVAIIGIISALTGVPSTPWHITIGNPKKPVFSSGDMYMEEVNLKLGPVLAWNDLPSSISIEFTLTNARPLGAQEIFNRFNTGKGRSYVRTLPDIVTSNSSSSNNSNANATIQSTNFGNAPVSDQNYLKGNGKDTPFA